MNWLRLNENVFIVILVMLSACNKSKNNPGYTYFPDMEYSRAYETYTENPNFNDNQTLRTPVEGTIPLGFAPFPYEKTDKDMFRAGKELTNPLEVTDDNPSRGKVILERVILRLFQIKKIVWGFLKLKIQKNTE